MTESVKDWHDTLAKLMRKAEDPACSEAEREKIMVRVSFLMAKHSIDESMLRAKNEIPEPVIHMNYQIHAPYANQKKVLLNNIALAFGCRSIELYNDRMSVYGQMSDLEKIFMLYGSLSLQLNLGLASAIKPVGVHGKAFNTSFVNGYMVEVVKRVKLAYARAREDVQQSTTGNGMELVLRSKEIAVKEAFVKDYPHTHSVSRSMRASNANGYSAGKAAGANADIGQSRVGGRKTIGS